MNERKYSLDETILASNLLFMSLEAQSAVDTAKRYRAEMEALPSEDGRRLVYLSAIYDLLALSRRFSSMVVLLCAGDSQSK